VVEFKNGRAVRIRTYLDPKEALEAVGLSEQENVEVVRAAFGAHTRDAITG
jgi:hypothetical protein